MSKIRITLLTLEFYILLIFSGIITYCQDKASATLSNDNVNSGEAIQLKLPDELKEISGLAYKGGNYVYTHNDERGIVFKVSLKTGKIIKHFNVGNEKLKKDFEGIAVVGDSIFLTTSDGVLYKFREVENNGNAEYQKYVTGLTAKNNIEGLCYDKKTNSLLLACKDNPGKNLKGFKAVYSYDLNKYKLNISPRFLINLDSLKILYNIKDFSPTGIEVHPENGNFFILSSNDESIIELSEDGKLLNAVRLNPKDHIQPEGITFVSDLSLILSDEGKNKKAKLTVIPFQK